MSLKKPESVSTSTSIVPYQTLSSIYNDSTQTASNQTKLVSLNNASPLLSTVNVVSSSDDRDDNDVKKKEKYRTK